MQSQFAQDLGIPQVPGVAVDDLLAIDWIQLASAQTKIFGATAIKLNNYHNLNNNLPFHLKISIAVQNLFDFSLSPAAKMEEISAVLCESQTLQKKYGYQIHLLYQQFWNLFGSSNQQVLIGKSTDFTPHLEANISLNTIPNQRNSLIKDSSVQTKGFSRSKFEFYTLFSTKIWRKNRGVGKVIINHYQNPIHYFFISEKHKYLIKNIEVRLMTIKTLVENNIPFYQFIQQQGEALIIYENTIYMSFSYGFSYVETIKYLTCEMIPKILLKQKKITLNILPILINNYEKNFQNLDQLEQNQAQYYLNLLVEREMQNRQTITAKLQMKLLKYTNQICLEKCVFCGSNLNFSFVLAEEGKACFNHNQQNMEIYMLDDDLLEEYLK